jgi:carbonic anhydrase
MTRIADLFQRNRNWAAGVRKADPTFFDSLAHQQSPEFLWIGCSDSRVPANQITGLAPGEVFVHRNVGNLVVHTDLNCLSVLQFGIDLLRVRHVCEATVVQDAWAQGRPLAVHGWIYGVEDGLLRDLACTREGARA